MAKSQSDQNNGNETPAEAAEGILIMQEILSIQDKDKNLKATLCHHFNRCWKGNRNKTLSASASASNRDIFDSPANVTERIEASIQKLTDSKPTKAKLERY
jgi:hypothetical protein